MVGGLGTLILLALAWGVFGSIPKRLTGEGILIRGGTVLKVTTTSGGQISELLVTVGTVVTQGQVVARMAQPQLSEKSKKHPR